MRDTIAIEFAMHIWKNKSIVTIAISIRIFEKKFL